MKRGFLNKAKAKGSATSRAVEAAELLKLAPDSPSDIYDKPPEVKVIKLPIGKVDKSLPKDYQPKKLDIRGHDCNTVNYPSNMHVFTTLPSQPPGATLADNKDNWSECLFRGGTEKQRILSTPGFPSPIPRPPRFGRGVFATCYIMAGELAMSERALLVVPRAISVSVPPCVDATLEQVTQAHLVEHEKLLEICVGRMLPENRAALFKLHDAHTEDGSGPILGRVRTNGFSISGAKTEGAKAEGVMQRADDYGYTAVYNEMSYINHSCTPNVAHHQHAASFSGQIHALRDIKKGEEIFISYCDIANPTAQRQASLQSYGFQCTCRACSDPKSDALLAAIKANLVCETPRTAVRLAHAKKWLAQIEAMGWEELSAYGTFLLMAISSATMLGKKVEQRRYQERYEAWTGARFGKRLGFWLLPPGSLEDGPEKLDAEGLLYSTSLDRYIDLNQYDHFGIIPTFEDNGTLQTALPQSTASLDLKDIKAPIMACGDCAFPPRSSPPPDDLDSRCSHSPFSSVASLLLKTCTTTACLCTTANASLLQDCTVCIVSLTPTAAAIAAGQNVLNEFAAACTGVAGIPSLTLTIPSSTASGPTPANSATAPANTTPIQPPVVQSTVSAAGPTGKSNGAAGLGLGLGLSQVGGQGAVLVTGVLAGVVLAFV
ncbi:hypothetical protein H0H81_001679 [Sphagnurus paluster]|uniref:SET domain-containing protein n=1 Tax=Sphagnurus paluster TaxID=117069 RepID=A0A9P7KJP8_9AGAR|nr:hypothetical protein H0H81_001679 [Sphagnurus paluster]